MATASKVELSTDVGDWPEYYRKGITQEQASKASELLQENHDRYHTFFRKDGFHNHIAHHLLAIWALRAPVESLQKGFDKNKSYQRQLSPVDKELLKNLSDPKTFLDKVGQQEHYGTFMRFFEQEIEKSGWEKVLQKYMFAGDEQAETMLVRLFAGFLHPIIHLGYGVEFRQPAIMAEALAQAAVHDEWIGKYLQPAEKAAKERGNEPSKSIVQLLDEIRVDEKLKNAAHWEDGNKIRDGIIPRAGEEMINYAAQYRINEHDDLEEKNAEMINAVSYYTLAAQHPPNMWMVDFYFMHCVNSSIFFSTFIKHKWLSTANKARLLEWKVRMDIAMYASRKCPDILLNEIREYKPRQQTGWDGILDRVTSFIDDGHAPKLIRALAHGQKVCQPYENKDEFRIKHDDWLQMGHLSIDSVENTERFSGVPHWVRSAGFPEAWEDIPLRSQL